MDQHGPTRSSCAVMFLLMFIYMSHCSKLHGLWRSKATRVVDLSDNFRTDDGHVWWPNLGGFHGFPSLTKPQWDIVIYSTDIGHKSWKWVEIPELNIHFTASSIGVNNSGLEMSETSPTRIIQYLFERVFRLGSATWITLFFVKSTSILILQSSFCSNGFMVSSWSALPWTIWDPGHPGPFRDGQGLPCLASGYVKIASENGHWNSWFSH